MKLPVLSLAAKLGLIGGLILVSALTAAWKIEERRANKLQTQVVKWQREFARLSNERNEQKTITRTRIVEVERRASKARPLADRARNAPLPAQSCPTPDDVVTATIEGEQ